MTTCIVCGKSTGGTKAKRCKPCSRAHKLEYAKKYYRDNNLLVKRRKNNLALQMWEYINANAPCTPQQISLEVYGYARCTGQITAKLEGSGFLVWLDEQGRISPYREVMR